MHVQCMPSLPSFVLTSYPASAYYLLYILLEDVVRWAYMYTFDKLELSRAHTAHARQRLWC